VENFPILFNWHRSIIVFPIFLSVSLCLHPLRHNWPWKPPNFSWFVLYQTSKYCPAGLLSWLTLEYNAQWWVHSVHGRKRSPVTIWIHHILAFLIVIMRFHSKTYWGSRELYDRNTCIQIYNKKLYDKKSSSIVTKYCPSIVTCILPEN
jgi:hypothetical protein